jgi:hypothetical protein
MSFQGRTRDYDQIGSTGHSFVRDEYLSPTQFHYFYYREDDEFFLVGL